MDSKSDSGSKLLHGKNLQMTYGVDQSTLGTDLDTNNMSDGPLREASMSPGSKRVHLGELSGYESKTQVEDEAVPAVAKLVQRPVSSGEGAPAPAQYQMKAASIRTVQVKRPTAPKPPSSVVENGQQSGPSDQVSFQPQVSSSFLDIQTTVLPQITSSGELALPRASPNDPQHPTTHEKRSRSPSLERVEPLQSSGDQSTSGNRHPRVGSQESSTSGRIEDGVDNKSVQPRQFQFAPLVITQGRIDNGTHQPAADAKGEEAPEQRQSLGTVHETSATSKFESSMMDAVLPSIEGGIDEDETVVESTAESALHHSMAIPALKRAAIPKASADARPAQQDSVLSGRVAKKVWTKAQPAPSMSLRPYPTSYVASGPSEEDMLFLIMRRNRLSKERELELSASNKQLRARGNQLYEQSRTLRQQLATANAVRTQQDSDISTYKSEVENFKTRFTKIKDYAKSLAQDYTDVRDTMKKASSTLSNLVLEKDEIRRDLNWYKQGLTVSDETYAGMKAKISDMIREAGTIEQALHLAREKARINTANLQHERLRNKRIETQILRNQHTQQQLSLSSIQEYKSAASYLDNMCLAVLHLNKIVNKKVQPRDTPGVELCLHLLQKLKDMQSAGTVALAETKTVVSEMSERLLTYHTTAEGATIAAASQSDQLRRDVLDQMATKLGAIGPSIITEVEFATLQEKNRGLQAMVTMGYQQINETIEGKRRSEQREKEQARRMDKLIDQVAEAIKLQAPAPSPTPSRNFGHDLNVLTTKWMQANQSYVDEQRKVSEKDAELQQKRLEIVTLQDKLKSLQAEHDMSQARLTSLETVRGDADAILQRNIALQSQLEKAKAASIEGPEITILRQDLAARVEEISRLKPEASKVAALDRELAARGQEISKLQAEASKVPELSRELVIKDAELVKLRPLAFQVSDLTAKVMIKDKELTELQHQASRVSSLSVELATKEAELKELRPKVKQTSVLADELASRDAEIADLRPKAIQYDVKASQNMTLQLDAKRRETSIRDLEQQLTAMRKDADSLQKEDAALKVEVAKSQKIILSLQTELEKSQLSAQQVEVLQKEIATKNINWGDHQQLKEDLQAQQNAHAKHISQIGDLESKLAKEQDVSRQIPFLRDEIEQLSQKCGKLGLEVAQAKNAAEKIRSLEASLEQKDEEVSALRIKIQNMESAQEDCQQKNTQLAPVWEQISNHPVDSERLPGLQKHQTHILDEDEDEFPTQQTILELAEMLNQEEVPNIQQNLTQLPRSSHYFTTRLEMPQHKIEDPNPLGRNEGSLSLRKDHSDETHSTQKELKKSTDQIDATQQIPDSQPQADTRQISHVRDKLSTSSPLSDLQSLDTHAHGAADVQVRGRDSLGISSPSNSYGGEGMLLDAFEGMESTLRDSRVEGAQQQVEMPLERRSYLKHHGYGRTSSRTIVNTGGAGTGHHRLRSGVSSQVLQGSPSQEQRLLTPNFAPSSPAGTEVTKHLPNSAAKRPRLDTTEVTSFTKTNSKRLKRTPANLDIRKTPSKRPMLSDPRGTESDRASRASLPSGSRKGTIIGANAPAPSKAQGRTRPSRKGSKSDRYAGRFNQ